MTKKNLLLLFSASVLYGCNDKMPTTIKGSWSIDTIIYKKYDIKLCLSLNVIEFEPDTKFSEFPSIGQECEPVIVNSTNEQGNWRILKSNDEKDTIPYSIKINIAKNEVFNGIHKLVFYRDEENKLLKMMIFSDSLYIICSKGLYNYDRHITEMMELENRTWTTKYKK